MDDGIVFKVVENHIEAKGKIKLISLNSFYEPYDIKMDQVREVWRFVNYISKEMPLANQPKDDLAHSIELLRQEVRAIQTKLDFN
jgi:hypothetical protein